MREFFINSFEKLVTLIIVLIGVGVVLGAFGALFSGEPGSLFAFFAILIFGAVYMIMVGGILYLALGIYDSTRRTADAVERLSAGDH